MQVLQFLSVKFNFKFFGMKGRLGKNSTVSNYHIFFLTAIHLRARFLSLVQNKAQISDISLYSLHPFFNKLGGENLRCHVSFVCQPVYFFFSLSGSLVFEKFDTCLMQAARQKILHQRSFVEKKLQS